MSWYNPLDDLKSAANSVYNVVSPPGVPGTNADGTTRPTAYGAQLQQQTGMPTPLAVNDATRQALLAQQGGAAGQFANQQQQGYNAYGQQGQQALNGLQAMANGQSSVSALQLRQALQQNVAAQQSMAAGASPQNAAMAARTAAIQSANLGAGLAGQQAVAGLAERNQAQTQYTNLLGNLRGQDLNAALGSRQNAETGYGAGATGTPQPTWIQQYGPAIAAGASIAASDRRLKTDIDEGDASANKTTDALKAYVFRYKDQQYGKGKRIGVMAQDLERAGLKHAVIDTPAGKMIHGGHLAAANTAMLAALAQRVGKLEGGKAGAR